MTTIRRPRPRERIGADAARVWARELVLGNPYAKSILLAVANYMNEDGTAWPGLATIARDTDISEETVAKRLRWLEGIGAIAIFKCWRDENGRRNFEGRGKPTASEIRFLFDADVEAIEAAAHESVDPRPLRGAALKAHEQRTSDSDSDDISARHGRGLDSDQHPASPQLAPDQPPPPAERHIDSLEQDELEEPPNPPAGGGRMVDLELEEDITEFVKLYPSPVTDMPRLRAVLAAMARPERSKVILGVKGYASFIADCERRGKPRGVKDAHRWVAAGMWQGYVPAGERTEAVAAQVKVPVASDDGKAWAILHKIAHITPLEFNGTYTLPGPLPAQALAVAHAPPEREWIFIPAEEVHRVRAWNDLIARELVGKNRQPLVWERNPGGRRGFMAPWPWPPRKDGSLCTGPPDSLTTDADLDEFAKG